VRDDIGQQWSHPIAGGLWEWFADSTILTDVPFLPDNAVSLGARYLRSEGNAPRLRLFVATLGYGSSIQLSCHDSIGYVAQGSRALFGYSFLFTPRIPIFMAGEEFDATVHPVPWESTDLFGAKNPGQNRLLYGSMLNWRELDQPRQHAMWSDVKRMLAIRKQEHVLTPVVKGNVEPKLLAVPYMSDLEVPVPYMRWNEEAAILVVANPNTGKDVRLTLEIPLHKLGWGNGEKYIVTDLWSGGGARIYSGQELARLVYTVKRDKVQRGGLGILKIERADERRPKAESGYGG
jgi:hypothetical protein